jgi:UDP-glucose 4-epimerase
MKSRYLVTGGAGFIGSHVVDALLSRGEEVSVVDIKTKEEATNLAHALDGINYVEGDIRDSVLMEKLCSNHTHVVHLAAVVSVPASINDPVETHDTNVNGTLTVFESARKGSVKRVIYASSAAVYGDTKTVPTPETETLKPLSPYGLHKVINEEYARLYTSTFGLPTVGLRFFNVFGERQDPSSPYSGVISIFGKCMREGKQPTIFGDGKQTRDFVYVGNIVHACLFALEGEGVPGDIYNVGTGMETSLEELVASMNRALGTDMGATRAAPREGDIARSCASIEKIQKDTRYSPDVSLEEGLMRLLAA